MRIVIRNICELPYAAGKLLEHTGGNRIFAFYGTLGAGKTTFIKAICELFGAVDTASSPTFTIVNEYRTQEWGSLYHIDFYRIKSLTEVYDIGIEEYLYGGNYCFIEWPELAEEILPENTTKIRITVGANEERIIEFS